MDWNLWIEQTDDAIRKGQLLVARERLRQLNLRQVPREQRAQVANLCRRTQLYFLGLRLLNPIVRADEVLTTPADDSEMATYAALLIKIGAVEEGLKLIAQVNPIGLPEVLLYQASGLFFQWKYRESLPILERFTQEGFASSSYQTLIGKVNLFSAYIHELEMTKARNLQENLIEEIKEQGHQLLYGNVLELSAQLEILEGRFDAARMRLSEAKTAFGASGGVYANYVRKWWAICQLLENGPAPKWLVQLEQVRRLAQNWRDFQTQRECDFYISYVMEDTDLFNKVLFGTPHASYRGRMIRITENQFPIYSFYDWQPGALKGPTIRRTFDVEKGKEINNKKVDLTPGQLIHRFFRTLSQDFYQPAFLGQLYSQLFPGEYFNPDTSPPRVSRAAQRFRGWVTENKIPIHLVVERRTYRLAGDGSYAVRVKLQSKEIDLQQTRLESLKQKWEQGEFSSSQARVHLGLSNDSVWRLLSWALEQGLLEKSGRGRGTRYRFAA